MRKTNVFKTVAKAGICAAIVLSAFTFGSNSQHAHAATTESIKLISESKNFIGTPYKYGAPAGVTYAFDCSSFTQFIFKGFDVSLPRTSTAQAAEGEKVAKGSLSMGDLVFFKTNGKSISHVAIYAGNNKIVHSSSSKGVTLSSLNSGYWSKYYVTARRVL
ncbi:C40 family peptidase [Paenibacillus harenae]|uniref:Cell wall-associated NlpC family hydrolase n=1 Tax=Paenibacillus harenae TaxID=306543 RepID=A0ABT9TYB1_PAEHA|nr:C40 family peptidase [Paenibacillus harenae]MDQ0111896.1 cell wall-associated NlpC family hydrolase [Paenibacillus harenae]